MSLYRKGYRSGTIFAITSANKTKPIFAITHAQKSNPNKRTIPFLIQRKSAIPSSPTEEFPNQISGRHSEEKVPPVFKIEKREPSKSAPKTQLGKDNLLVFDFRKEKYPIQNEKNISHEELKEEGKVLSNPIVDHSNHFEEKIASIFHELQLISQELAGDYLICQRFFALNPSMLNFWYHLQSYLNVLHQVTLEVSLIPGKHALTNK